MEDNWKHRSQRMRCRTCMFFVPKETTPKDESDPIDYKIGRCRRNAPTLGGYPVVFPTDWCGQHKLDEDK